MHNENERIWAEVPIYLIEAVDILQKATERFKATIEKLESAASVEKNEEQ